MAASVDRKKLEERVGTSLRQRYSLDSLLDVGGMAAVYAGRHKNGRKVAIKILHPELAGNADVRQRFLREGYVANAVEHPSAVQVLDDDKADDGTPYLVMDLLRGVSLEERLAKHGVLSPEEALYVVDQVLDVLAAAHEKGIVHLDIAPANVFLTEDGPIRVLDFGLARMRRESFAFDPAKDGVHVDAPHYVPPEQARGKLEAVDWRADIWAVGALAYESLVGRFEEAGELTMTERLARAALPMSTIARALPELSGPVVELIDTALEFRKEDRFQTARLMQRTTRTAYQELARGSRASSEEGISTKPSWASSRPTNSGYGGLGSVTLLSEQAPAAPAESLSIDVRFDEPIEIVADKFANPLEKTLISVEVVTDSMVSEDVVTSSMVIEPSQGASTEPIVPPDPSTKTTR